MIRIRMNERKIVSKRFAFFFWYWRKKIQNYNALDGNVDRTSWTATYKFDDGRPLNPKGRTGCRNLPNQSIFRDQFFPFLISKGSRFTRPVGPEPCRWSGCHPHSQKWREDAGESSGNHLGQTKGFGRNGTTGGYGGCRVKAHCQDDSLSEIDPFSFQRTRFCSDQARIHWRSDEFGPRCCRQNWRIFQNRRFSKSKNELFFSERKTFFRVDL